MIRAERAEFLRSSIMMQFYSSTVSLDATTKGNSLWLTFSSGNESHSVTIPLPYERNGVTLISNNGVERAISNYFMEETQEELDYAAVMYRIICGDPTGIIPERLIKKISYLKQIASSFSSGYASMVTYNLQRAINEVINRMPLHESNMNSWTINHRLIIIDPAFDELVDPQAKLQYQIDKNKRYFDRGWTSIGLSDGVLANKNYILKTGIRKFSPFGNRHDNPGRNLYSTQEAKGDEYPRIRSESMQALHDRGMNRTGWNWATLYADVPDVFEDQIIVDASHKDKFIEHDRRHVCFGVLLVKKGQIIKYKQPLSVTKDGEQTLYTTMADKSVVRSVEETVTNIGGSPTKSYNVVVRYRRHLRDGTKITNLHGNKGVIRLKKIGYAIDPRTGEKKKIDVISSAKSVQKRKNFGQVLEAVLNTVSRDNRTKVIRDNAETTVKSMEDALERAGYPRDGMFECKTYAGDLKGVFGDTFWGVTKEPEDQLWGGGDTLREDGRGLRTAGIKFSNVEFRAIRTRFGKDNPLLDEIMSYSQGTEDIHEQISVLKSKKGEVPDFKPVVSPLTLNPIEQQNGSFFSRHVIAGSAVDESFCPNGYTMQLPFIYQTQLDKDDNVVYEGYPQSKAFENVTRVINSDKVYIPSSNLRRCWRHGSGKYGLSDLGVCVNNLVKLCHQHLAEPENALYIRLMYATLKYYFTRVAERMGTKRGEIATYGMAVRYPFSTKAVATLSNSLPKNNIEIHRDMAKKLNVSSGDVVLVERFPCLGFMSVRPQKVVVTSDPMCKYTIRVSGNSLGSLSLDFDGDVLFIASFHSKKSKKALVDEWTNPNKSCYGVIKELNKKAGAPHTKCLALQDYGISKFDDLTNEEHAELVSRATGVKSHTGPVIALAYNIMRILENSSVKDSQKTNVAIEVFLDKVGNSVFKQKHGVKSLHDIVIDAICTADVNMLVEHGFKRGTSTIICKVIQEKARELGIMDLKTYHEKAVRNGWSKIINLIVRKQNKIYFASRAQLEGCELLKHLENPAVDLPSKMLKWAMAGKHKTEETQMEKFIDEKTGIRSIQDKNVRDVCEILCVYVTRLLTKSKREDKVKGLKRYFSHLTNKA